MKIFTKTLKKATSILLATALLFSGVALTSNQSAKAAIPSQNKVISGGYQHTLALKTNGTVWSWGANNVGQLGDNGGVNKSVPMQVAGVTGVISVVASDNNSLALKSDGTVWSWGLNTVGQLGTGDTTSKNTPTKVPNLTGVTAIEGGYNYSLALKSDGTVWTWGLNTSGQLGDGTLVNKLIPTQVVGLANVVAISAGNAQSLALKSDGSVWAWGANTSGQLGDGTTVNKAIPAQVNGLTNVTALATGNSYSSALTSDGTVWAWGDNSHGQLGDGTKINKIVPTQILNFSGVTAISNGAQYSMALKSDGTVFTWGYNNYGQLGDSTANVDRVVPTQMLGVNNATAITAGSSHSVILKTDGTLLASGQNFAGQLGDGTTVNKLKAVQAIVFTTAPTSQNHTIAGGQNHSLFLKSDGTVWASGYNSFGQLGNGSTVNETIAYPVVGLTNVTSLAAGFYHSLALKADGTVWTWGNNGQGQLGDGTTVNKLLPVQVSGLTGVIALAGSNNNSFALKADGTVWAWGYNGYGNIGDGTLTTRLVPVQVSVLTGITAITAGQNHAQALKSDGTVWSWGDNSFGQAGTTPAPNKPIQVPTLSGIISIASEQNHSLALKEDGTVMAWGQGTSGQLGDGYSINRTTPIPVGVVTNVIAIATGASHSQALKADGTVWEWGSNAQGQLGDGTLVNKGYPTKVPSLTGVLEIASGYNHSMALKYDGTLWSVGANSSGQLGDGTFTNNSTPVKQISYPITSVKKRVLAGGQNYTITLKNDGTVWSFGQNNYGQLGDNTTVNRSTPVQVSGLTGVISVDTGSNSSFALKSNGTVWAWGDNYYGELGDGTGNLRKTPVQVSGLTNVIAIASANDAAIALKSDGTLWSWGNNVNGQIGDGTTTNRYAPVQVAGLSNMVAIAGGDQHFVALRYDGLVFSWGADFSGQLGDGSQINLKATPVQATGLTGVTAIAAGEKYSLALASDGTIWAWGINTYGQLGLGANAAGNGAVFLVPNHITSPTGVTAIDAGQYHSIALKSDGTLLTFGRNNSGQLGDGTLVDRTSPTPVSGTTSVTSIAAGFNHSIVLKSDGSVWAWGLNSYGQLGDGTTVNKSTPVKSSVSLVDQSLNNATAAVVKAEADASGSLATQPLIDTATLDYTTALNLVNALPTSVDKTSLLTRLTVVQQTIKSAQDILNATNAVTTANTLSSGDLSTQALINSANQAITTAQTLVSNLATGSLKTSLQNSLTADSIKTSSAQDIFNATTAVNNANTLASGDLSSQTLINSANQAITSGQTLVNKLVDGTTKTSLQSSLTSDSVKTSAAQSVINASNAVTNATTLVNGDLSTQILITSANDAINSAQTAVSGLPDGSTKTSLQTTLNSDISTVKVAQNIINSNNGVANATALATGDLSTQALIDSTTQAIASAQTSVTALVDGTLKTSLQAQLNTDSAYVLTAQNNLNANIAVTTATTLTNADLTSQGLIDATKLAISNAQTSVNVLVDGILKTTLQTTLDGNTAKVVISQDYLTARNGVQSVNTVVYGDLSTQALVDIAKLNIANVQALVNSLDGTISSTQTSIDIAQLAVMKSSNLLTIVPVGSAKDALLAQLVANNAIIDAAQAVIDAKNAVSSATTLVSSGLDTQVAIDNAQKAVTSASVLVTALPIGTVQTSLQTELATDTSAIKLAQTILDTKNVVDSVTAIVHGDLSTQPLIDSATKAISDAQVLVTALPDGTVKTTLQNTLTSDSAEIVLAQNMLNAVNAVNNATATPTDTLLTQPLIDLAVKTVADAQILVTNLPDSFSKSALQSQLSAYSIKVQVAQDELNTTIMVDNAFIATNDLSTQVLVDIAKQKIIDAQTLVTSLAPDLVKTTLQGRLDVLNAKVQLAQDVINDTILVDTAAISTTDLRTQVLIDASKKSISDAQIAVTLLPICDAKTLLQSRLDDLVAKVQVAQDELNAQIAVDAAIASIGDLSTQVLIDTAIKTISDVQVIVTSLPVGTVKDVLQVKLDAESAKILEAQNTLNAINAVDKVNTATVDLSTQPLIDDAKKLISDAQVLVNILVDGAVKTSLLDNLTSASAKVVTAQSTLDQINAATVLVNNANTLVNGDLSAQSLIDFANSAIKNAQVLVTALLDGKSKSDLQSQLNTDTLKVLSAQSIQDALNAAVAGVNSTGTLVNGDLSTQLLIDSASNSINSSQALVNVLENSAIKTSLQDQLTADVAKVATAQSILDAINTATNAVNSAGTLANGDLSTQPLIDSANKAIIDAQALVTVLADSTVKTTLQNQLTTYTSVVNTAQSNLNALNIATTSVANVDKLVTGDLSTQALIDSATQALSIAQIQVTNLVTGVAKTSLQGQLTAYNATLVSAQDALNAIKIATTAVNNAGTLANGLLDTQVLLDAAKKAIIDAQVLVTALVDSSAKVTLQGNIDTYSAKVVTAQNAYTLKNSVPAKANLALDTILGTKLLTYSDFSTAISSLMAQRLVIKAMPASPVKTALLTKYNATVLYIVKSIETFLSKKHTGKEERLPKDILNFLVSYAMENYGSKHRVNNDDYNSYGNNSNGNNNNKDDDSHGKVYGFVMPLLSGRATGNDINDSVLKYTSNYAD